MRERASAVVLAAGGSSRLGRSKQLVVYGGFPLVVRAARTALETGADPVAVVIGAHASAVAEALSGLPVIAVLNPEWDRGIGRSIATGVRAIIDHDSSVGAVLVLLADQPLVDETALGREHAHLSAVGQGRLNAARRARRPASAEAAVLRSATRSRRSSGRSPCR